jgi:hypothetical protein
MKTELRRFVRPLESRQDLLDALASGSSVPSEPIGYSVNLRPIRRAIESLRTSTEPTDKRSWWDAELVEPVHRALVKLPVRVSADMRFWHWLCATELAELVWKRWHGEVPETPSEVLTTALMGRFLGAPTLAGVSRNSLARLWWCARSLHSTTEGYRLVRAALEKQDLFQAVFERKFGLYPAAARACIRQLKGEPEVVFREATKKLNQYLTTIVVETLSERDVEKLLPI